MQLTRKADYAVRVMLDLAEHAEEGPVPSADVARRQAVPKPFLRKVVRALARGGYVSTRRGPGGGIALARDPKKITLRAVIEAIEGPIRLNRCLIAPGACPLDRKCSVHPVWRRIQDLVLRELECVAIDSLTRSGNVQTHPLGGG